SVEDIEDNLHDIFLAQPGAHLDADGQPCINADNLVDVIREFSRRYGGEVLMTEEQIEKLQQLLEEHPNLTCNPTVLIAWLAKQVRPNTQNAPEGEQAAEEEERGRSAEVIESAGRSDRSSSNESTGTRRATSRPPQTPTATRPSVFDRRQRTTPIGQQNPPSSFSHRRPAPASRRRSIDGATSDSERSALSSSTGGRRRAPSNPPTPSSSTSPSYSRPHSRTASQPHPDYRPTHAVFSPPLSRSGHSSSEDESSNGFPRRSTPSPPPRSPSPTSSDQENNSDDDGDDSLIREYHGNRTLSMASIESDAREEILS
ncbi:hypothetical protein HDZ31DRAFT_70916, partial [Schizophyllum fasciatum]